MTIKDIIKGIIIREYEFGPLFSMIKLVEDKNIETAYLNQAGELHYNPAFFEIENPAAVLMHEILHYAFDTFRRMQDRDPFLWNLASDLAINSILKASGIEIRIGLLPENYQLPSLQSAEYYYDAILSQVKNLDIPDIIRKWLEEEELGHSTGTVDDLAKAAIAHKIERIADVIKSLLHSARNRGTHSVVINKLLGVLEQSRRLDWKSILRTYLQEYSARYKYDLMRKSKRGIWSRDIYVPKRKREKILDKILVAIDVSGSIDDEDVRIAFSETQNILLSEFVESVELVQCDYEIVDRRTIFAPSQIDFVRRGRGGTSFIPPVKLAENEKFPLVIYFSADLDGDHPESSYVPIIWITKENKMVRKPPIGRMIFLPNVLSV